MSIVDIIDEEPLYCLKKLSGVRDSESNFTLIFEFDKNKFFRNSIIKKHFIVEDETPIKSLGDKIEWNNGFNCTTENRKNV